MSRRLGPIVVSTLCLLLCAARSNTHSEPAMYGYIVPTTRHFRYSDFVFHFCSYRSLKLFFVLSVLGVRLFLVSLARVAGMLLVGLCCVRCAMCEDKTKHN